MPETRPRHARLTVRGRRVRALLIAVAVVAIMVIVVARLAVGGGSTPNAGGPPSNAVPVSQTPNSTTQGSTTQSTSATAPASATASATTSASATASATAGASATSPSDGAAAAAKLAAAVKSEQLSGRLAVAVLDVDTGADAGYDEDTQFVTASIVKVDILATLLLQNDGELSSSQRALAVRMIEESDNAAASALWIQIGRASGLKAANRRFGLTETTGGSAGYWGLTTTTAADQVRLLQVVFTDDSPLNARSRSYLTGLMDDVEGDQDWGVPAAADSDQAEDAAYVKNGWLPRSTGWVINSIGSVRYHGHTLLIAELSDRRPTMPSAVSVLEKVAPKAAAAIVGS